MTLKLRLYAAAAAVLSVLIYGCEAWVMTNKVLSIPINLWLEIEESSVYY